MATIPQNIEELFSAIQRRDHAQLSAWLDLFSSPQERYAALRALAETLQGQQTGPAPDLARWASNLLYQSLGTVGDDAHLSRAASCNRLDDQTALRGAGREVVGCQ